MAGSSPRPPRKEPPIATHGSGGLLLEDPLPCFICLDVLNNPVSTVCGHDFCKSCLTDCWDKSQHCACPLCKTEFSKRPELKINTALKEASDHYKNTYQASRPEVLCDVCPGVSMKALKSCLDCGLSLCESHLEPHNNVKKLKKHKLINPVKNLEDYICQKHEKPLEMFCTDDQTYVCQFCTEGRHMNHNVIRLEKLSEEKKTNLEKTQIKVHQGIRDKLKKIHEVKHVELSKKSTAKDKADRVELFIALIRIIEKSQAELLEMIGEKQKAGQRHSEGFIKELKREISELKKRDVELQQLLHTDDHLNLLKVYPSVWKPPPNKNWPDIVTDTDLNVMELPKAMLKLQKTLNEKLSEMLNERLRETELKRMQRFAVDVTLDPETAHPSLVLSKDQKQVRRGQTKQNLPATPKRFMSYLNVLGQQGFSSRKFCYEVQVNGKTEWSLGVARESVNRKGEIIRTPQTGFWTIKLKKGVDYTARDNIYITLSLKEKPQKVGVFVDYEEGLVSFYDVENRSHIYSFTGQFFTEKLYPYFSLGLEYGSENSAPLIISPFLNTSTL